MPYHFDRHFTLEEARALLTELRRAFARIHELLKRIERGRAGRDGEVLFFSANGHGPRVEGGDEGVLVAELQSILDGLHERGVQVKDLRRGLCDFPYLLPPGGEEVLLCWELCEADIGHWHTPEGGFAGRVRLTE